MEQERLGSKCSQSAWSDHEHLSHVGRPAVKILAAVKLWEDNSDKKNVPFSDSCAEATRPTLSHTADLTDALAPMQNESKHWTSGTSATPKETTMHPRLLGRSSGGLVSRDDVNARATDAQRDAQETGAGGDGFCDKISLNNGEPRSACRRDWFCTWCRERHS